MIKNHFSVGDSVVCVALHYFEFGILDEGQAYKVGSLNEETQEITLQGVGSFVFPAECFKKGVTTKKIKSLVNGDKMVEELQALRSQWMAARDLQSLTTAMANMDDALDKLNLILNAKS